MKKVRLVAGVLDRLALRRGRQRTAASATRPMSDRELAIALREIFQRNPAAERKRKMQRSAMTELRLLGRSLKEQDARTIARSSNALNEGLKTLRDPAPDTFLGRRTQVPFPNMDEP